MLEAAYLRIRNHRRYQQKFTVGMFTPNRLNNDCDTYVVMEVEGSTVILNGADDAQTREIYNNIRERMEK